MDNNSSDNTALIVREWEAKSNGLIKYYFEARQGSHFARNGVVKYVKGELLYFTDDDMIADKNMLTELVGIFQKQEKIGTATGRVLPKWESEPPLWLKKYFVNGWLSLYDRDEEFFISKEDFGVFSCHQAVLKNIFIKAGGYNPDIVNGEWLGDNETGLNIKIKALNYKFAFVKGAVTYHMIPSTRMTQKYFNKRFANQGNCDSYTDYRQYRYTSIQLNENIKKFKKQKLKKQIKFFVLFILRKDKWRINRAWIDYYKNRIIYNNRLINDENWRKMTLIDDWIK